MIKRSHVGIIDFTQGDDDNDKIISYCKHCLEYNIKVPLKNRIYPNNEPIPVDHENWLQCHECGSVIPVYEVEKESRLKDVVETTDNPFDSGKDFLGVDSRKTRKNKQRDKQFEDIKDENLRNELAKGNTLISYTEYQPK